MFRFSYAAKVGLIFIVALFLGTIVADALGYDVWSTKRTGGYKISVLIESTKGLTIGSEVLYNGTDIGEVDLIDRAHFGNVRVVIIIDDPKQILHENAYFAIAKSSIFSSSLLYISEPKGGFIKARGKDNPNVFTIEMPSGETVLDSKVYYHGASVGTVLDIVKSPDDEHSDIITIEVDPNVADRLNDEQTFVPTHQQESIVPGSGPLNVVEEVITGRIDIYDRIKPGDIVEGTREPGLEDLVVSTNELVQSAGLAMSDVSLSLNELVSNLNTVLTSLNRELSGGGEGTIKSELVLAMKELQSGLSNIEELTGNLNDMLLDSQPKFENMLENMESAAANIEMATGEVNDLVSDQEMTESFKKIMVNLEASTEELLKTIEEIESLVSDEEIQEDLRGILSGARDVVDKANDTIDKTTKALETVATTDLEGELRVRYLVEPERVSTDLEFTLIPGPDRDVFYRIGMDDIGEIDGFNFQLGYIGSNGLAGRFGIKRGEVGAGFDYYSGPFTIRGDLYDPNDLHFDIYGGFEIGKSIHLILGFEDLYDEDYFHVGVATEF